MSDLISRCELFNRLATIPAPAEANEFKAKIYEVIQEMETADRPQGHYIKGENGEWYCSNCKRIDDKYSVARFCWWCRARMKGADDDID